MEIKLSDSIKGQEVKRPQEIANIIRAILKAEEPIDQDKEHFWAVGLRAGLIHYIELVGLGVLNAAIMHPRELFRMAILKAVNTIIIIHNHPSGNAVPSQEDQRVTSTLVQAGDVVGIKILDHVIVTETGFYSFKDGGLI